MNWQGYTTTHRILIPNPPRAFHHHRKRYAISTQTIYAGINWKARRKMKEIMALTAYNAIQALKPIPWPLVRTVLIVQDNSNQRWDLDNWHIWRKVLIDLTVQAGKLSEDNRFILPENIERYEHGPPALALDFHPAPAIGPGLIYNPKKTPPK